MKSQLAVVLVVLGVAAYASAGSYGPHGMIQQQYMQPQIYRQQTQMYARQPYVQYAYAQPQVAYGQAGGSGGLLGQSGAAAGSIIPIVIICKLYIMQYQDLVKYVFSCVHQMFEFMLKIQKYCFCFAVVIIAILAPVLIGSLVSSNDVVYSNSK